MSRNASPPIVSVDPLPRLVAGRFRVLSECTARGNQNDRESCERLVDEALRRARRLDEQIVRTVATSTSGLLAQLRLLCAFYDESTNGMGRRGALLIQTIAAGIKRLDQEIDGTRRFEEVRESREFCHPSLMSLPSKRMSRCH
jgi:hypothetical protein